MLLIVACAGLPTAARATEIDSNPTAAPPPAPAPPVSPDIAQSPAGTVTVTMAWTAPGDDSLSGIAASYDMRYAIVPLSELTFATGTKVTGLPVPGAPGTLQTVAIPNLQSNTTYYFAIKTTDERGNWSGISNIAVRTSGTAAAPGLPQGMLDFAEATPNPARSLTRFAFTLPRTDRVQADVFDITGRHIRTLLSGVRPAGRGDVQWDLSDDAGRALPAGVYLVHAQLGTTPFSRRVVIVH